MDDAVDGGGGADPQREGEDGRDGEPWLEPALTQREADVLRALLPPVPQIPCAVAVAAEPRQRGLHPGEPAVGFGARGSLGPSALDEFTHALLAVVREFFAHFLFDGHAPQQGTQSSRHAFTITLLTAAANAAQACASPASCLRPAGVSR